MRKLYLPRVLIASSLLILAACEGETPTKYIFDKDELKNNTAAYIVSKGPMDKLGCMMTSMLMSKEVMEALKNGKKPNIENANTPTSINLYKEKIEWIDRGQETAIKNNAVDLEGGDGKTLNLTVTKEAERLLIGFKDKELECRFPFKKSN